MKTSAEETCRLCLDPFTESFDSIESPEVKERMEKVFTFTIEPKVGFSNIVCQNCSCIIAEFYQYSEKVRLNQEQLPLSSIKQEHENIKVEPTLSFFAVDEIEQEEEDVKDVESDPKAADSNAEEEPCVSDDSYKPVKKPSSRKRKRKSKAKKASSASSSDSEPEAEIKDQPKRKKYVMKTKEERDKEEQMIREHYKLVCDICGEAAESFVELDQHSRQEHNKGGHLICCNKKIYTRRFLVDHVIYHNDPDSFYCKDCNKRFKSRAPFLLHNLAEHGTEVDKPYKCDRCTESFVRKCYLTLHMQSHETHQCEKCHKFFASKISLSSHMDRMHSDKERKMICDTCGQEYLDKMFFERHVKEHMGIAIPKFQCHVCQKWYKGERHLQIHIERAHVQIAQSWQCDICFKFSKNERALKKHKQSVHVEEKHECEFCGRKFKRPQALQEHRATHTGVMLYSCEVCGLQKNSRANLYVHFKQKHPHEWTEKKLQAERANAPQE